MDIQNSFQDVHNSIFGYPKIELWISKNTNQPDFRISIIRFIGNP